MCASHYSLHSAMEWVDSFRQDHTRATDLVLQFLGLQPGNLEFWAARDQISWNNFKKAVKLLEKPLDLEGTWPIKSEKLGLILEWWLRQCVSHGIIKNKQSIDKLNVLCNNLRAHIKGGSPMEYTPEGNQLLLGFMGHD